MALLKQKVKINAGKGMGLMLDGCLEKAIQRLERANAEPLT